MGLREAILARDQAGELGGRVRPDVPAPGDVPPYVVITTERRAVVHGLDGPLGMTATVSVMCVGTTRAQAERIAQIVADACESEGLFVEAITASVAAEAPETGNPLYVSTVIAESLTDAPGAG